ncbi:glycosyltransferase [Metallosphaera javensis (ex Sakai et al. 2022)]|uniref:glycosyltransferase n=1 Tax=Metallosphaera javensis (ex Sakai et al. 2022) TaxID=2775498 RepID=UPI00258440AC|nr:MAG: dolichyl-phosphate mannose synthase [Metallosphaera javensis (ex Sakai et al. 2022)]
MPLSIVIPAYNEERRIERTLSTLVSMFRGEQILVVFDGNDRTPEIVKNFPVELIVSSRRLGKGGALREGLLHSRGEYVVFLDADLPVGTHDLEKVINLSRNVDLVVTTRIFRNLPTNRSFLHRAFVNVTKAFFPSLLKVRDFQSGLKVARREKLLQVKDELIMNDWLFDVNLIYSFMRRGYTVSEVEVEWDHEDQGSKISRKVMRVSLMMFLSLVKLRTYYSPFRGILGTGVYRWAESRIINALR